MKKSKVKLNYGLLKGQKYIKSVEIGDFREPSDAYFYFYRSRVKDVVSEMKFVCVSGLTVNKEVVLRSDGHKIVERLVSSRGMFGARCVSISQRVSQMVEKGLSSKVFEIGWWFFDRDVELKLSRINPKKNIFNAHILCGGEVILSFNATIMDFHEFCAEYKNDLSKDFVKHLRGIMITSPFKSKVNYSSLDTHSSYLYGLVEPFVKRGVYKVFDGKYKFTSL